MRQAASSGTEHNSHGHATGDARLGVSAERSGLTHPDRLDAVGERDAPAFLQPVLDERQCTSLLLLGEIHTPELLARAIRSASLVMCSRRLHLRSSREQEGSCGRYPVCQGEGAGLTRTTRRIP